MNLIVIIGRKTIETARELGKLVFMVKNVFFWLFNSRLETEEVIRQTLKIGVESIFVSALTSLFTGMVLSLQTGYSTVKLFNEPLYVGTIVGFSLVRELSPVLTAVIVAGRAGSNITAELGTMAVTEQINALYTLGTNPYSYLLIPRYIAFMIALPVLTLMGNIIGTLGGAFVAYIKFSLSPVIFFDDIFQYMDTNTLLHGLSKTFFFAFTLATISCYKGLYATGGAEGVGRATTQSVVLSIIMIFAIDYFAGLFLIVVGVT